MDENPTITFEAHFEDFNAGEPQYRFVDGPHGGDDWHTLDCAIAVWVKKHGRYTTKFNTPTHIKAIYRLRITVEALPPEEENDG